MSVVIIGGHDRMHRQYKDICKQYKYKAKVYTQPKRDLACKIGNPDLIILFTSTIGHNMMHIAKEKAAKCSIELKQSHCSSCAALHALLNA